MKKTIIVFTVGLLISTVVFMVLLGIVNHIHCAMPLRMYDMRNLHQIGLACEMFAKDHNGRFPDDWSQLSPYINGDASNLFVMPQTHSKVGSMTNVMEWTDYVYIRGATTSSAPSTVVAFLPPGSHPKSQGAVVLFADSHVQWRQSVDEFTRTMNRNPKNAAPKPADPQP